MDFNMAHINLSCKAILDYPVLVKFMAATNHGYNIRKMLGCSTSSLSPATRGTQSPPSSTPTG